jgi:hypothetical protein
VHHSKQWLFDHFVGEVMALSCVTAPDYFNPFDEPASLALPRRKLAAPIKTANDHISKVCIRRVPRGS